MDSDPIPSSSPAFGTPVHPFRKNKPNPLSTRTSILPLQLPPSTLRPVAFRTFTRKHNLTISSTALQTLANFVGKNCGAGWREEGLAERVLDEVAKSWKKAGGGVIVEEGKGASLNAILQAMEGNMSGGRVVLGRVTTADKGLTGIAGQNRPEGKAPQDDKEDEDLELLLHPRHWTKVIDAFDIPRLTYNADKRYFEIVKSEPSLFPSPSRNIALLRDRYNIIYQRLLRNESFQTPLGLSRSGSGLSNHQHGYRLTPIANLLGRSGTSHLLLGLLSVSPTGELTLSDLTGSIAVELSHAQLIPQDGAWFTPGMIVLVDGIYEEEENVKGSTLGGNSGIGGTIGGRFVGVSICGPPCERRDTSFGTSVREGGGEVSSSGGLGWVDFLGLGSERARGPRMRQVQARCVDHARDGAETPNRFKVAVMSEVNLDNMKVADALRRLFGIYNDLPPGERPMVFVLVGNFVRQATVSGGGQAGSIEYKEYFDSLAGILSDFPSLLQRSTFVFVPGDNDPWSSAFSAGAASPIPRQAIPELFTSRIKRAFSMANAESDHSQGAEPAGEAIWTSNPSRLSLFGPVHELAIFRDDISGRLRRCSLSMTQNLDPSGTAMDGDLETDGRLHPAPESHGEIRPTDVKSYPASAVRMARKLVKTILDQGSLSPFPLSLRPVLWDYASSLQLYPLPTGLILADAEAAPFCMTYEGCHVMNPGRLIPEISMPCMQWIEYDVLKNRGRVREERY
ncbi:DNA polymerase epsilon noncatalytic subunit [Aspergillus melleus]|uniref:DNA polymerase epsilon noncatalytic subunit n=1 Tax=Aspergillus melleus TaxID=138277 RepID=UPI001E8DEBA1|nr:DNA-directed DNA polymerase epsilon, subunit B [Aspergillus melleus]KAH8434748.1 DNA-directed DNA polymerase epsilon, subunit B [Aspergillus melleus]